MKRKQAAQAVGMFNEMADWLYAHQVTAKDDPYRGCIYYPSEDRYCNRDTACMARVFMRRFRSTGEPRWKRRAAMARDYVLRVQKPHGGFPELSRRHEKDDGSTVNTGIVAANLIGACELGLACRRHDLTALAKMADFVLGLEWRPGAFYHDLNHAGAYCSPGGEVRWGAEGSHLDCQNTTALACMMLLRVSAFLEARGVETRSEWAAAAGRAVGHLLEGQRRNGLWTYYFDNDWKDGSHQAMVMSYLAEAAAFPPHTRNRGILPALRRGARWLRDECLLQTGRGSKINWAVSRSACVYFTHEYFLVAAALAQVARLDPKDGPAWRREALDVLRYVRTDLWDNPEYEAEGPFRLTEAGIRLGHAWFGQSLAWAAAALNDAVATTPLCRPAITGPFRSLR